MKVLLIFNVAPYGTGRGYNGMRLGRVLIDKCAEVTIGPMPAAVFCARSDQKVPKGCYNL